MKPLSLLILLSISLYAVKAQTWEEWTQQKQTQVKYLLQQIAALKVYAETAQNGYKMVKQGLTTIQDIKDGDFQLHLDHISALKHVNPAVKGYANVILIRALQAEMVKVYSNTFKQLNQSKGLHKGELRYYQLVCNRLLQQGIGNLSVLTQLTANDQFQMTDGERIQRIDALYEDMQDKRAFLQHFCNEAKGLAMQRVKEKEAIRTMQLLHNLK